MLDKPRNLDALDSGGFNRSLEEARSITLATDLHPAVVKIALSAVAWFIAAAWLDFAGGIALDLTMTVVTGLFVMFLTLLLSTHSVIDRR